MNVYLYTAHITVSQGGLQFYLSEIGRQLVINRVIFFADEIRKLVDFFKRKKGGLSDPLKCL